CSTRRGLPASGTKVLYGWCHVNGFLICVASAHRRIRGAREEDGAIELSGGPVTDADVFRSLTRRIQRPRPPDTTPEHEPSGSRSAGPRAPPACGDRSHRRPGRPRRRIPSEPSVRVATPASKG